MEATRTTMTIKQNIVIEKWNIRSKKNFVIWKNILFSKIDACFSVGV